MTDTAPLTLDDVLARLRQPTRTGGQWSACCPAHDDNNPSMTVREGEGGRIVFHCHRGCSFAEIADALNLPQSALMGAAAADSRGDGASGPGPKPPGEDYDYEDESGRVLFRVSRYYTKSKDGQAWEKQFAQKKHLGNRKFSRTREDARLVIYNLPAVRAAIRAGEPVYVVEGEKDVHALRDWGLVGTCNPGGAGKWDATYGAHLAGADVVVIPDNDDPGRRHADDVVASARPYAEAVRLVSLPGLREKGDLSDWRRLGHTRDELLALTERAEPNAAPGGLATRIEKRPLVNLPEIEPEAHRLVTESLRRFVGHYPAGIDRTVALTTALSVISGMFPNVRVAHYDKDYGLHLMFCLVARSGGGKGVLDSASRIASAVDHAKREDSTREQREWDVKMAATTRPKDRADMDPRPFDRMYVVPANASKAYALRAADACGETACIVETEIDTFADANAQEWGDFTDFIRKAFHHETYRQGRIGAKQSGETLTIERPSLAMAISGTWGQFAKLYRPNLDNGFYNRFCFLVSNAGREFRSQRPTEETRHRERGVAQMAAYLRDMEDVFSGRGLPLVARIPDDLWDLIDGVWEPEYSAAQSSPIADRLLPLVQRTNLMCVRVAGILATLRAYDMGADVGSDHMQTLIVKEVDVRLALHIAGVWFTHGRALLTHLSPETVEASPLVQLPENARAVYDALPDVFKKAQAVEAGQIVGVTERTIKQYMSLFQEAGLVARDGHTYTKAPVDSVAPFVADFGSVSPGEDANR